MKRMLPSVFLCVALWAVAGLVAAADKPERFVSIEGNITKPQAWTTAQIKADFAKDAKTISYTAKDGKHSALAVPLLALVNAAGPQLDPKIKNHSLRFVVVVQGSDGYMATFAWAELLPDFGKRDAWVTLDVDGKALPERDAPASLIVPADEKPARSVHGIKTIRVVDMGAAGKDK